jgi:dTDP-4-amino-4,6-dideoxygalactose transaminase
MKVSFNDIFKSNQLNYFISDLWTDYSNFRKKKYSTLSLELLTKQYHSSLLFLTHSATGALEIIAKTIAIQPGDEVIMSSFTYVSTANAFVANGAKPVFVDVSEDDFNLDTQKIQAYITIKTKAIVVTHYGGHATDLNQLRDLCDKHKLYLIEDAAMGYGNYFDGKPLGTIGHFGVISFDITKQISAIQGGLLIVNDFENKSKVDAIYNNGTNRSGFENNSKPHYEWIDIGSKYQMNEQNAVVLYDNLINQEEIIKKRKEISKWYFDELKDFPDQLLSKDKVDENIHLFYWLEKSIEEREALRNYLLENGVEAMFHYIPLHISEMGKTFFSNDLPCTEKVHNCLIRLPMHVNLNKDDVLYVCDLIKKFTKR